MKLIFKSLAILSVLVFTVLLFTCCDKKDNEEETTDSSPVLSTTKKQEESTTALENPEADANISVDTYIILDDEKTAINGHGANFENGVLTITQSGTYSLEGTLSDGRIYINSPDENKKVKLYLCGVSVSCSTDAPLFVENSPKETILILKENSVNTFSDTEREVPSDENADYATATIYSKDDLQIEGSGTLNISGNFNKGIFSKNDIDIHGGTINITSVDDGIRGKESVEIIDGILNITSGGDGIRTNETTKTDKGSVVISGGTINITSDLDCIQSVKDITVSGGTFNLISNGGATKTVSSHEEMGMGGPMGDRGGRGSKGDRGGMFGMYGSKRPEESSADETQNEDTPSTKAIKADGIITVTGGTFTLSSTDDCLHAKNTNISGGAFFISSDDDGIHADETVNIENADINIDFSYEGIEGTVINIGGGNIYLKSSDDGFNAAGDTTSMNPMQADYSCEINVTDGYIHIDADGDGVDSNGNVNQSGGTIIVFGPQSGANGALDYGGTYTVSGGTLLALGSQGMAQSVTGDGMEVLAFNYSCTADTLNAIADEDGNAIIGFKNPKNFATVVFVSDKIKQGSAYSVFSGGSFDSDGNSGVWLSGNYTKGSLVGTLS